MPTKFKPSETVRRRGELKATTNHYYIKIVMVPKGEKV